MESILSQESKYKTAKLRADLDKRWVPTGFEPGETVHVRYWQHAFDVTCRIMRPLYYIAKTADFEAHFAEGTYSCVYNAALESFQE